MNTALIMMGGRGTRFGAHIPKQFVEVDGQPVFVYLVNAYQAFDPVERIVVVCHQDWTDFTEQWCSRIEADKVCRVVSGGSSRSHSVQRGLDAVAEFASADDVVLIHDVTHPFIDVPNVLRCIEAAGEQGASTLAGSCYDTMYTLDGEDKIQAVAERDRLVSATAPECFRFDAVYPMYAGKGEEELSTMTSAGAMMVANGHPVQVIRTPLINLKITLHEDMDAFRKLLHGYYYE